MQKKQPQPAGRFRIPPYVPWVAALMVLSQLACYYLTRLVLPGRALHILTIPLDARIPLSPPWITVYFLSFPFWIGTGLRILLESKPHAYRVGMAYALALLLSAAVFLIWPGTMERPEITGTGVFDRLMILLYRIDSPTNLCPSLHVLATYFCWRGQMGCQRIPGWYRVFSFLFLPAVCASILLVKQHALIDIPAGILIGETALQCARLCRLERIPYAVERYFTER